MRNFKIFLSSLSKFYLCNFALVAVFVMVVVVNFMVQFKVESLQDKIEANKFEISSSKDQIALLEVEWAYLTRPSRIRELASKYLQDNSYSLASQIKSEEQMQDFYLANYKSEKVQELAANF
jgi:hypothetical protein